MGGDQSWIVGGNRNWKIQKGDDNVLLEMGSQSIKVEIGQQNVETALGITLTVAMGVSSISITPASISMISPVISLTGETAINLMAPAVNIGAVLNTPSLIAGAAVIGGIPI